MLRGTQITQGDNASVQASVAKCALRYLVASTAIRCSSEEDLVGRTRQ